MDDWWLPGFFEDVVGHLQERLLPMYSTEYPTEQYFRQCEFRVYPEPDNPLIQLTNLDFYRWNSEGELERVDDRLSDASLDITFQPRNRNRTCETWTERLTRFSISLKVPNVFPPGYPPTLQWEQKGDSGRLKAYERYQTECDFLDTDIHPEDAIPLGITHQLNNMNMGVASFYEQSAATELSDNAITTLFTERQGEPVMSQLEPWPDQL